MGTGLFINTNAYAYFKGLIEIKCSQVIKFFHIIEHGNGFVESQFMQALDIAQIIFRFKPIMNNGFGCVQFVAFVEVFNQIDIKGRGRFEAHIFFEGGVDHVMKMIALGAVTESVLPVVIMLVNGLVKMLAGFANLFFDFRQVAEF